MGEEHVTRIDRGKSTTAIFIHGLWGNKNQTKQLWDGNYNVIAMDLPGHGSRNASKDIVQKAIQETIDLVDQTSEDVILIGFSLGGIITQSVLLERPEIKSGIIISSAAHLDRHQYDHAAEILFDHVLKKHPDLTRESIKALSSFVEDSDIDLQHTDLIASLQLLEDLEGFDCREQNANIKQPVYVFHGRKDKLIPVKAGIELATSLPNALFTMSDGSHNTTKNDVLTKKLIERFLRITS